MSENKELDKRVALAMGWNYEPDQEVGYHSCIEYTNIFILNGVMVASAEEWTPTTDPATWHAVEVWMRDNFTDAQKLRFSREFAFLIMEKENKPIAELYDLFEAVTAPLVTRCRAFLAAVEGGDRIE